MEALSQIPIKSYQQLRHDIRSGDILLCSGNSVFSTLIEKATNSIWSHVGFVLRIDAIERIMLLESVESIGVRTVPLSSYVNNYNGTGKPYPGRLMLARHRDVHQENIAKLSRTAVDLLGFPYRTEEIVHISTRISMYRLGIPPTSADAEQQRSFICSEYVHECFKSIGITINYNPLGFIAPADFARDTKIMLLNYIETENVNSVQDIKISA